MCVRTFPYRTAANIHREMAKGVRPCLSFLERNVPHSKHFICFRYRSINSLIIKNKGDAITHQKFHSYYFAENSVKPKTHQQEYNGCLPSPMAWRRTTTVSGYVCILKHDKHCKFKFLTLSFRRE